ncbi:MAG TPA: hypothetical protein VIW24_14375 [Aldersonia sp.]
MNAWARFVLACAAFYVVYLFVGVFAFGEELDWSLVLRGAGVLAAVYLIIGARERKQKAAAAD